jgi:hypothetical protein
LSFEIAEPMWQDGATASRFVALPDGKAIETKVSGKQPNLKYDVKWPTDAVLARTLDFWRDPRAAHYRVVFEKERRDGLK